LARQDVPEEMARQIMSYLTLDNTKYLENEKRGRSNHGIDPYIYTYEEDDYCIYCYRGYTGSLIKYLSRLGYGYKIIDKRRKLPAIDFSFKGNLRPYQTRAVMDAFQKDFGIVVAPCGSGKTVMACKIIAERKQPTLIVVHTKELLNQWIERIIQYLGISRDEIGVIGAGREIVKPVTVGMVQTLIKRDIYEIKDHFGQIVVDECHHSPASTFLDVVSAFDSYYMLGLSATPYRRDRLNKLIFSCVGNVSATVKGSDLRDAGTKISPTVVVRNTDFYYDYKEESDYQPMISELISNSERNNLIATDIASEAMVGNFELVLSDRKAHLELLHDSLKRRGVKSKILTADVPKKKREQIIKDAETGALRVILAIGALAGEGLDLPKLNRLFVTTPVRFKGRIVQYAGRALRVATGKTDAKIYDYNDINVGVLASSFRSRHKIYCEL